MRRRVTRLAAAALFVAVCASGQVRLDFFYEPGCDDCHRVRIEVLPLLAERYAGAYVLHEWDVGVDTNYLRLARSMERLGVEANARVYMVVGQATMLAGFAAVRDGLFEALDEAMVAGMGGGAAAPANVERSTSNVERQTERELVARRMAGFTVAGVVVGGLVDGINPCAIATLVFLVSVLSMAKVTGRRLLLVGAAFCLASFLTYTAIGFGLLRALHLLSSFNAIRRGVELALVALLIGLAVYSFRDAIRFRRSARAQDVSLQLPDGIKRLTHRLMRTGLRGRAQVASAFGIGAAVTALESVCTGQVYVPTLALVVKGGGAVSRGLTYLLLYNLMFILPLVVVFVLTYHGMKLTRLLEWSKENVVLSKILLGCFFVSLAIAMAILR